jgi:nucleoid DNA-binding protein
MRLKELNDAIAAACNVRANVVTAVQNETFRQIRAALDRGEKVVLPDFGSFVVKEGAATEPGAPAKRVVRFREQRAEAAAPAGDEKEGKRRDKAARKAARAEAAGGDDEED